MTFPLFPRPVAHVGSGLILSMSAGVLLGLAACGGGSATPPAGGVPGLSSPAGPPASAPAAAASAASAVSAPSNPSASSPGPESSVAGASISAQPGAVASSQAAPGTYKQNGTTTVTNGQATIQATDGLQWQPNTIMAKPGDKVTLTVHDSGNTAHAFVSPALGVSTAEPIPNGKASTVVFTVPNKPGTYQFWCNIPGHAEAGMVGEVIAG